MLQANSSTDPIVEILRLAYRRGLAIQREKERTQTGNQALSKTLELVDQRQDNVIEQPAPANLINE
jgi:hypothetical protein